MGALLQRPLLPIMRKPVGYPQQVMVMRIPYHLMGRSQILYLLNWSAILRKTAAALSSEALFLS